MLLKTPPLGSSAPDLDLRETPAPVKEASFPWGLSSSWSLTRMCLRA